MYPILVLQSKYKVPQGTAQELANGGGIQVDVGYLSFNGIRGENRMGPNSYYSDMASLTVIDTRPDDTEDMDGLVVWDGENVQLPHIEVLGTVNSKVHIQMPGAARKLWGSLPGTPQAHAKVSVKYLAPDLAPDLAPEDQEDL